MPPAEISLSKVVDDVSLVSNDNSVTLLYDNLKLYSCHLIGSPLNLDNFKTKIIAYKYFDLS